MLPKLQIDTLRKGLSLTKNYLVKQSPILLTIAGVGGVITTTVLAVRATTKAEKLIEEKKLEKGVQIDEDLTIAEKVETVWKEYIPTALSLGLSIAAIVGSSAINEKRKAALAGLYALSETALSEYQEKTKSILGEKKEEALRADIAKESLDKNPVPPNLMSFGNGQVLCHERMSGRYFLSSVQDLKVAEAELNQEIMLEMCASLNDFYSKIGLDTNELGDEVGWSVDHLCSIRFDSCLTSEGVPCLVLDFMNRPSADYRDIR